MKQNLDGERGLKRKKLLASSEKLNNILKQMSQKPTRVDYLNCPDCGYASPEDAWGEAASESQEVIICPVCDAAYLWNN